MTNAQAVHGRAHPTSAPWLQSAALILIVTPFCVALVMDSPMPMEVRVTGAFLWSLCILPGWWYLRTAPANRRPIPFLPLIGVLYGLYYALPAALGSYNQHYRIVLNPRLDYGDPIFIALVGWWSLLGGYIVAKLLVPNGRLMAPIEVTDESRRGYGVLLTLTGLAFEAFRRVGPVPIEAAGLLAFLGMLGWFGSGLLVVMLVQRRLTLAVRLLTYASVIAFFVLAVGSGSVAQAAFYGTVLTTSAWIGIGRLKPSWVISILFGLALIISLRGVTEQYRKLAWLGQNISLVSRTKLFMRLLHNRVEENGVAETVQMGLQSSASRSANLDLLSDVILRTPREIPYWGGYTYLTLVGSFVPRFLWPDKPAKQLGQAFGHRYGYVGKTDEGTAFNLPILVEFYLNFGLEGILLGMALVGILYYVIQHFVNSPGQDYLISLAGVVLIIPLLNIESDFSLAFGGLIMNGVALAMVLRTIRRSGLRAKNRTSPSPLRSRLPGLFRSPS
jgi:hypothetical protein